jgi:hypothetical protein
MTKKDYELIAGALRRSLRAPGETQGASTPEEDAVWNTAVEVAASFIGIEIARHNPRFDRERFMKACELES